MAQLVVYQIPVCPFCQRLEILLALKGRRDAVNFHVVDITRPRPDWLVEKTRGTTALPVLERPDGGIIRESLVILRYLEDVFSEPPVAQRDPWRRAVEGMMVSMEGDFAAAGYGWVMNQDSGRREVLRDTMLARYAALDDFLLEHAPQGPFLFDEFGWAETVFTPLFMRFWFLEYYEDFRLPDEARYDRVRAWVEACIAHRAAQQVSREQVIKLYYDYARGAGNGALLPGRSRSSFAFEPHWRDRPWPPKDKYGPGATDEKLGLL
ncbi:glutathione S-transferase [Thioalkalivibrio denitrificans]|uniref:Glutathione S-transferase n=1 Tax=Thioalkalivibrio denitrificans TaxID=108003 RepID=A0A1V3NE91_9GAMM|nr:glutathione S-transferase family protein [Thioalkalivibrio denitrificans]OOG23380.1 glutathione S-transferase [Thioalkalivibrio denitrificans]